ncbi:SDR family NAD(P)-dependent oxidoreductase [Bradyrhizobium sp.]|uniref:SDR family NAD(P)-dependent oxidoreductase n=1 Tax=Bradyrhizobium sp. TaxID=376 RepID=UPI0039E44C30
MKAAELFDLSDRVVVVTGAASGLGLAISEVVAANGARVVMLDIDEAALGKAAATIARAGAPADVFVADVGEPGKVKAIIDACVGKYGRLDCVFANAGASGGPGYGKPEGAAEAASMELWESCLRVNLDGAFLTIRAAAKHMKAQRQGSIVVTSSVAALRASALPSYAYHAAKAGIAQVVRVAALELGPHNVRVNGIAPGPFKTNIGNGRMHTAEGAAMFAATVPLGRLAELDEIKGLALLLASPASSYMTGAIIPIDGGTQA